MLNKENFNYDSQFDITFVGNYRIAHGSFNTSVNNVGTSWRIPFSNPDNCGYLPIAFQTSIQSGWDYIRIAAAGVSNIGFQIRAVTEKMAERIIQLSRG